MTTSAIPSNVAPVSPYGTSTSAISSKPAPSVNTTDVVKIGSISNGKETKPASNSSSASISVEALQKQLEAIQKAMEQLAQNSVLGADVKSAEIAKFSEQAALLQSSIASAKLAGQLGF